MAETKPTKVARWATDGGRTLEPAAGEKNVGWEVSKKPPARFMNWLHWVAYSWFNWLNERMFDGATAADLEVTGVDAGAGTDLQGGDLELSGGQSTGDESSDVTIKAAVAGGAGAGNRAPETFLKADGANKFLELKPEQKWVGDAPKTTQYLYIQPAHMIPLDFDVAGVGMTPDKFDLVTGEDLHMPLHIPQYAEIKSIEVYLNPASNTGGDTSVELRKKAWNAATDANEGGIVNSNSTGAQTVTVAGINKTVVQGEMYTIMLSNGSNGTTAVHGARVTFDYDRPPVYDYST